jgi:hypothetical protein
LTGFEIMVICIKMNDKILKLIKYIVCFANDHDISLTTIRLVKFVYLADLYHARLNTGETITHFPWAFVNYGPYCQDVMKSIDDAVLKGFINSKALESKYSEKDYKLFFCYDDKYSELRKEFKIAVLSELQYAIKKYGDDTAQLLDYVYFNTEPMNDVKKGDILDFSLAVQPKTIPPIETKKLSRKDVETAKALVKKLKEKYTAAAENLRKDDNEAEKWRDDLYLKSLDNLDTDPLPIGIKGTSRINV